MTRQINFRFVDFGTSVRNADEPLTGNDVRLEPGEVYLDVGNSSSERILDHHHDPDHYDSAARLATERFEDFISAPLATWNGPVTLITHLNPDLDGCAAMFFVHEKLIGNLLDPAAWRRVVDMVSENDQGYLVPPVEHSFPIIFRALAWTWHEMHKERPEEFVRTIAFPLIRECHDVEADPGSNQSLWDRMKTQPKYRTTRMLLERAAADYKEDCRHGQKIQLFLPRQKWTPPAPGHAPDSLISSTQSFTTPERNVRDWSRIDGIIMQDPVSLLFKELARTDRVNSQQQQGFQLMLVHKKTGGGGQHIVSTDPMAGVSLKGLGADLEALEKKFECSGLRRRLDRNGNHTERVSIEPGRHGYGVSDPWYDGRGHYFTIVDNPASGSVLSNEEVQEALWQYGHPAHFVSVPGLSMSMTLALQLNKKKGGRKPLLEFLQGNGWTRQTALRESVTFLSSSLETLFGDNGTGDDIHVQHWEKELSADETSFLPREDGLDSSGQRRKARLIIFPYEIAFLTVTYSSTDDAKPQTLLSAGGKLERLRKALTGLAHANPDDDGGLIDRILGPKASDLVIRADEEPYFLNSIELDETTADFDLRNDSLQKIYAQVCNAASLSLSAMPGEPAVARIRRLPSHCGRKEIWFGENCVTKLLLVNGTTAGDASRLTTAGIAGTDDLVLISCFQRQFLLNVNEKAAQAIEMAPRKKPRVVNHLNQALADFTTRWRTTTISDTTWGRTFMSILSEIHQLQELEDNAFKRISQVAERISNENNFLRDRLLFLLTVVFFPINLAAAMFSGIQMGPFETSTGTIRRWLPWQSGLETHDSGGWWAFLIYLGMFMMAGVLTYLIVRLVQRLSRLRA